MTNVLTLRMEDGAQGFFERQRQAHFPAERNQIPAHLTLFHTLPDTPDIYETLARVATAQPVFTMQVTGLRSLGKGVAYKLGSAEAVRLHGVLSADFQDHLSAQDRQRFIPHVVVQNKATPEKARLLLAQLERDFHALEVRAVGLDLWHYLGGPWKLAQTFWFGV